MVTPIDAPLAFPEPRPSGFRRSGRGRRATDRPARGPGPCGGGLALTGEGELLAQLTKRVVESALEGEITDHLGYDRHEVAGRDGGNSRNVTAPRPC